jgi:DNA-binding response OmpR family regulator
MDILLVEDDESLSRGISFKLRREGHEVRTAFTIGQAREAFRNGKVDLLLLDVGLPDGSGFDFCEEIRSKSKVFILFLTACDQEADIVTGYDTGADDYITKPFSLMVLLSKINAVQRRIAGTDRQNALKSGNIELFPDEMKLTKSGETIELTRNEYRLLKLLMENARKVLTKERILADLWDSDENYVDENTVAVNIRRLREKIEEDPSEPCYILNIRGIGYLWDTECIKA